MPEIIFNLGHIAGTEGQGGRRICPNEDIEFIFRNEDLSAML